MIVLKATQEKMLSVLQSVAGIVERLHTRQLLANYEIIRTGGTFQEAEPVIPPVFRHAPKVQERVAFKVCKATQRVRKILKERGKRRKRLEGSCWRLVGDGSTKRLLSA
jgi:hypothetical protein